MFITITEKSGNRSAAKVNYINFIYNEIYIHMSSKKTLVLGNTMSKDIEEICILSKNSSRTFSIVFDYSQLTVHPKIEYEDEILGWNELYNKIEDAFLEVDDD